MFSAADLQKSRTALKTRSVGTEIQPITSGDAAPQAERLGPRKHTSVPLPLGISPHDLASTRNGLSTTQPRKPRALSSSSSCDLPPGDGQTAALPAFTKRKEWFEKRPSSSIKPNPTSIIVRVGGEEKQEAFTVDIKTLRSAPRFRDELSSTAGLQEMQLPDHSPLVFQLFLDFSKTPQDPITYRPGQYSPEPWASASAAAWVLAADLRAARFAKYALSQFIQNCAIAIEEPCEYVERHAFTGSSLRRFSDHWVAWNTWLSKCDTHEHRDLQAAKLAHSVTPDTRDPRIFDIDHWYKACGDNINASCEHDPVRRRRQHEKQKRAERPPSDQWGYIHEMKAQRRQ